MSKTKDKFKEITEGRKSVYGDYSVMLEVSAKVVQACIEAHYQIKLPHPLPPHVMALMQTCIKSTRASAPFAFHQDNYDDLHTYAEIAHKLDERKNENT